MCNLSPAALDLTAEPERQDKCWQRTFPQIMDMLKFPISLCCDF